MLKRTMKGGQPFRVDVFVVDTDGSPYDLIGFTAQAQLRSGTPQGCEVDSWTSPSPEFTISLGQVTLEIEGATTIEYDFPVGFMDILLTHPTKKWIESEKIQIALEQSVTKISA